MKKRCHTSASIFLTLLLVVFGAVPSFAQTNFGSVNVTAHATASVTVGFLTSGTLGSVSVLTQGALLQDFANAGGGTCAPGVTYPANATCTVKVTFSPANSGTEYGAVLLNDESGNLLASAFLVGAGVAPQLVFLPGSQQTIGNNWVQPWATAVDGAGNIYVANYPSSPSSSGGSVVKETFSGGSYTQSTIGSGIIAPTGIAVDGQGNVYIVDSNTHVVYKETPSPSGYIQTQIPATGLGLPIGIAVDASGNLYISDAGILKVVKESLSSGSYVQSTFGNGLSSPSGIAVDGSGNVYLGDWGNQRVVIEAPSGGTYVQSTILNGIEETAGNGGSIAVDGRGNLYIAETSLNALVMYPWSGHAYGSPVTLSSQTQPMGVAVANNGNVFYTVDAGVLYSLDEVDPPSFSFESTIEGATSGDSPQTLTVQNIGNAALTFPVPLTGSNPSIAQNFSVLSSAEGACPNVSSGAAAPGNLAEGASCSLSVAFTPNAVGSLSGTLALTDNELNAISPSYTTQRISLSGIGLPKIPVIQWNTPSAITYGAPLTSAQLNATANVPGTFVYSPPLGTILPAGLQSLSVVFTPSDTVNYTSAAASVVLVVRQAVPSIAWSGPTAITYGTALGATQLDATSPLPGTFNYSPSAGTTLPAGTQTLSVTFTPSDSTDYSQATATVSLVVNKAIPSLTWAQPAPITYGMTLGAGQLTATSLVPGTYNYSPPAGTLLPAGTQTLSVTFNPTDTSDYTPASTSVSLLVNKAVPPITWATPAPIAYGTAISAAQLNATSTIAGKFTYSYTAGTILGAGQQTLSTTFAPTDTSNYTSATASVTLTVNQAVPAITWANPAAITYGTPLSGTQLNATSPIPGTFSYATPAGTILTAGVQTLATTFTPTDSVDYTTASATVSLLIDRAIPSVSWNPPAAISYGTPLSATQLNAGSTIGGTFAYSPGLGTILAAGTKVLSATFTPSDSNDYTTAKISVSLTINQAVPVISWATPAAITYGTMLSTKQLDAKASVGGSYSYSPAVGTIFPAGTQTLSVTFTPTDTADYVTATASVILTINKATPSVTWATPSTIVYGTPLSSAQLNATSSLPGTFAYSSPAGTVLSAGANSLSVTFTPTDSANYTTATAVVVLTVTKALPTVSWAAPAPITYGTALGTAQLNAVSSVPGSYVYSLPSGSVPKAGLHTITVTLYPTDGKDYSYGTASVSLTVVQAVLTVTAQNRTKVYGAALPSFPYVITGLVNGDVVGRNVTGQPAITTSATASSPVGNYPIAIAQGTLVDANYTFNFAPGSLSVTQAQLQVAAYNLSKVYGAALPALTYNLSGFVNGDTAALAVTGMASLSTAATAKSAVGSYPIIPVKGTLSSANYSFSFVSGTLNIDHAILSITANNAQSVYASVLPAFTYTVTGLVNGDTQGSAFTGSPSLTSAASKASPAGKYAIIASIGTLASLNYTFLFQDGSLNISKATLIVAPDNKSATYGAGLPQFTYQLKGFLNGDTAGSAVTGVPSLQSTATSTPIVGSYNITASLGSMASTNYTFSFDRATLTIGKAVLTVTADAISRLYGSSTASFPYVLTGFEYHDTAPNSTTGQPSITTTATAASKVGTYAITVAAGTLAASNYAFHFVNSDLVISKAPLTLTAISQSIGYGSAIPALTYQVAGLVNGDTAATAIQGSPYLGTTATITSSVGSYPITIVSGSLSSTNYSFTLVPGTLTINKAPLTITAINQSIAQGSKIPVFTFTISGFVSDEPLSGQLSGQPSLTTTATSSSSAGTYPIKVAIGTLTAPNYSFILVNGVLTVTASSTASKTGGAVGPDL